MNGNKPILVMREDEVDFMTVRRGIKELKALHYTEVALDGEQALAYLRDPDKVKPWIIWLDLNMPWMNGIDFLKAGSLDNALTSISEAVLASSKEDQDMTQSFNLAGLGYMVKPVDYKQFAKTIKVMDFHWTLSQSPSNSA